jgi:signal transduction histidine kinase
MIIEGPPAEELAPALNIWHGDYLIATLEYSPRFAHPEEEGFAFLHDPGGEGGWRVLVRYDEPSDLWTVVGIDLARARWAILGILGRALFPLLVVLPLTVLILYYGVSRGLRPLQILAKQIGERSPQLLEPIEQADVPAEIQPVVDSLNQLLQRLGEALESEQRFTANAAHELMTPLAAIKTEVQLCQRQVDEQGGRMLEGIVLRVDRATHTVQQLLTLARLDPEKPGLGAPVELGPLVEEVLAETGHLAIERGVGVNFSAGEGTAAIRGDREALSILLRNLLINAFRYAPANSDVEITLGTVAGGVELTVFNNCEALSAEHFARLQDRFYRVPGSNGTGAGLGLSIVARVAEFHNARLHLGAGPEGRGFIASVEFS